MATVHAPPAEITDLLARLNLEPEAQSIGVQSIGAGATAAVWRVRSRDAVLALRVGKLQESARMRADGAIRRGLLSSGARVARPLEVGVWNGVEFALDELIVGTHPSLEEFSRGLCLEIGETLEQLHALPCSKYGLLENRDDALVGITDTPRDGLLSRLSNPFPLSPLEENSVTWEAPELIPSLYALESELRSVVRSEPFAVNHTDLHGGQMLVRDGRLAALLDFGDATIGPQIWDIASFGYFHGWQRTGWLLEGYGADLLGAAQRFCVVLCLHHLNRAITKPERREKALERLRDTLERLR